MVPSTISELAQTVLTAAPLLGIYIVGAVLAVTHRRRAPRAAALVLAAVGLMAVTLIAQRLFFLWLSRHLMQSRWSPEEIRWAYTASGFISSGITAAGIFLLIMAAFTGRAREE
jgi:hypothetical protein